jgi:hypothetical protein
VEVPGAGARNVSVAGFLGLGARRLDDLAARGDGRHRAAGEVEVDIDFGV